MTESHLWGEEGKNEAHSPFAFSCLHSRQWTVSLASCTFPWVSLSLCKIYSVREHLSLTVECICFCVLFVGGRAFESATAPYNVQGSGKHRCSVLFKRFQVSLSLASVILEAAVQHFSTHEDSETGGGS